FILQIVGSAVLILYGIYLFRNNPSREFTKSPEMPTNYWRDFVTGFLFTFSNPLILFFIIGLFARFNFMDANYVYYHYMAGYLAIMAGALTWWFLITYFVDKVRGRFNMRTLWLINRVIAGVLIGMALIGTVHAIRNLVP
ncbi:MAG: LysE family transporter, partial [Paramuribaculum sp.]|nr:LysE family transporter [Paramuribaculum sp.]